MYIYSVTKKQYTMTDISKFAIFAANYPHRFIYTVWAGSIADHLQEKFSSYYDKYGAMGVMTAFYLGLDGGNRAKLETFIKETEI